MRKIPLIALLLASCYVQETRPIPPPPPANPPPPPGAAAAPARPALISEAEAVRIASNFARSRGLSVQRYKAKLDAQQRWRVDLKEQNGDDRAQVLIDARDGKLLRARLRHEAKGDNDWERVD